MRGLTNGGKAKNWWLAKSGQEGSMKDTCWVCFLLLTSQWLTGTCLQTAWCQTPPSPGDSVAAARPYDGIQAGLDAFRIAEEKRQAAIATQLGWNQFYRGQSIAPPGGAAIVYGGYSYGARDAVVWNCRSWVRQASVFEAWPIAPRDIYGVIVQPPLRQPAGQWQGQTGPNRWESHPVYDPPIPDYRPLPEVDSPLLDKTPFHTQHRESNLPSDSQPRSKRPRER
jgi:hypothetical protein